MTDVPTQGASSPPPDLGGVHSKLNELRSIQRGSRTVVLLMTLLILAETLVFVFMLYRGVESEFSEPRLKAEGERIINEFAPTALDRTRKVAAEVMPTYKEAAIARFEQIREPLAKKATEELQEFPAALEFTINSELRSSLKNLVTRLKPSLQKSFPEEMKQDDGVQKLAAMIETKLEEQSVPIEQYLERLFDQEKKRIEEALIALGPPDEDMSPADLERQWLHLLLQYADYELMNDEPATGDRSESAALAARTGEKGVQ